MRITALPTPVRLYVSVGLALVASVLVVSVMADAPGCLDCYVTRYWAVPQVAVPDGGSDDNGAEAFPELDDRGGSGEARRLKESTLDLGVAFSGGGTRAATATLGQLRGLRKNGWLEKVRYVSAVSGGAWAALPFTYTKLSLDEFLGPYEAPGALTVDIKKEVGGRLAQQIVNSSLTRRSIREAALILLGLKRDAADAPPLLAQAGEGASRLQGPLNKTFTRLLASVFIDPLIEPGETVSHRPFAWDGASAGGMNALNRGRLGPFVTVPSGRPFFIAGATLVSNRPEFEFPLLMPVEYTPLYVGVRPQVSKRYGGGYVWPWAYDAVEAHAMPDDGDPSPRARVVLDTTRRLTLADVAASTGAAPELFTIVGGPSVLPSAVRSKITLAAQFFPAFRHVGLRGGTPTVSGEFAHADGGGLDNLGVMPLLARRVKNVLVFVNTSTELAEANTDLQSLFFSPGGPGTSADKSANVVFDASQWDRVSANLRRAREQGGPQLSCDHDWSVRANAFYNVPAYGGLSICFVYNADVPAWTALLEQDVLELLKERPKLPRGREPTRQQWLNSRNRFRFPWYRTFEQNPPHLIRLKPVEVALLSNLTAWTVTTPETVRTIREHMPVLPDVPRD